MNAKQEFIKAVMSVLRLEANIYTAGAIEKIIERLKIEDYTMFIAYLGERDSGYEKPIESLAKGVEEFYLKKLLPYKEKVKTKQSKILHAFELVEMKFCKKEAEKNINILDIKDDINNRYSIQNEEYRESKAIEVYLEQCEDKRKEIYGKLFDEKNELSFRKLLSSIMIDQERAIDDKDIDMIYDIGIDKFRANRWSNELIYIYLYENKLKPSVTNQIVMIEAKKIFKEDEVDSKIRLLLNSKSRYTEYTE